MTGIHNQMIDELFNACIQNEFNGCTGLMPAETNEQNTAIEQVLKACNATDKQIMSVFDSISDELLIAEQKGFENGFTLGARLIISLLNEVT